MENSNEKEIERIISHSTRICQGMKIVEPKYNEVQEVKDLSWIHKYEHMFCYRNGHIAFVYKGNFYTTIYNDDIYITLQLYERFREANFWVPLCFGEYILK